jgi:hypothetical protein
LIQRLIVAVQRSSAACLPETIAPSSDLSELLDLQGICFDVEVIFGALWTKLLEITFSSREAL